MNNITKKIMFIFSEKEAKSLSTTELVKSVFKEEYEYADKIIQDKYSDQETVKKGKRKKAQLHRKLLYYINKLVEENILFVSKIKGRGEKHYVINPGINYEGGTKRYNQSVAGITDYQFNMVESFEHSGQINKFDSSNWYRRLNSILVEPTKDVSDIYERITNLYMIFNDVIGINDFQKVILKNDYGEIEDFLKKISTDAEEYKRHLTLIISLKEISREKIIDFINCFEDNTNDRISVVIYTDKEEFLNKKSLIKSLISKKVYIQNKKLCKSPILIGKSGVYTIKEQEYKEYLNKLKDNLIGILYGSTTVTVDYSKFRNKYSEFRKAVMNSAKSLIIATSIQRGKSDLFFFNLNKLNGKYQNEFYRYSSNKIRIKNYFDNNNKEDFSELITSINEELAEFSKTEETIFKSCGIPTRHDIKLALNGRVRLNIMNREDLKSKKFKWFEKLSELTNHNALLIMNTPISNEDKYYVLKEVIENKKVAIFKAEEARVKEHTLDKYL